MRWRARSLWPFHVSATAAIAVAAFAAAVGVVKQRLDAEKLAEVDEAWLQHPIPAMAEDELPRVDTPASWGRNPFLTLAECELYGEEFARADATWRPPRAMPDLRAVIRFSDSDVALLGEEPASVGQEVNGVRVLAIESDRVLVRTETRALWLRLADADRWKKEEASK